jgi:hypothetical protein
MPEHYIKMAIYLGMVSHGGTAFLWQLLNREILKSFHKKALAPELINELESVIWIEREGFFLSTETVQAMFKL